MTSLTNPQWVPDPVGARESRMRAFFQRVAARHRDTPGADDAYAAWHAWSVANPAAFWSEVWLFADVVSEVAADGTRWQTAVRGQGRMAPPDPELGPSWFDGARLNFAENVLRRRDGAPGLVYRDESRARREVSFASLHADAASVAAALTAIGVQSGDVIAGYLPNWPETVTSMLGTAWIGGVWTSCSPDFGVQGVLDRFAQVAPKVLIAADGYRYAGKSIDLLPRLHEIIAGLPSVERVVIVPHLRGAGDADLARFGGGVEWRQWLGSAAGPPPAFARLPFAHPLYVMYSSGTTGLPKCLVHGAGGTLLQHLKEHQLHVDLRAQERMFYFTTCGWMMWNWLVSALASEATVVLYDGAALPPDEPAALWDVVAEERVTVFGTSAKFLALSEKAGLEPARTHDLSSLRSVLSTGSPLAPTSFDYLDRSVRRGVHVASISGGTDLISCFALGNPLLPVWRGELQAPGLGMAVDVFGDDGTPVRGQPGELVCTTPFPSMPVAFWNDPDGAKYRAAYFDHFPGVWRHGDWAEITEHGGLVIHGRSDATLNPGGVRIGTAEIYRVVEQFPEVLEGIVVGQEITDADAADVRIVLFVRLQPGRMLDDDLLTRIRWRIRDDASPHHVPKLILQVHDIPRTVSGKITELAVREAFHGRPVKNTSAMANPDALDQFRVLGVQHRFRA